jgi:nitrite reductase (NADH) large subunit
MNAQREKLVCIGNGMAGIRTLEELLKLDNESYEITVFGAEPHNNYNRILLSPVLAGEKTFNDIILNDDAWYVDNNITLYKGHTVTKIDRLKRRVITASGESVPYDRLLIATGSNAFIIPVPGYQLKGVIAFRDIHHVDQMLAAARGGGHAVVIGGGLLGLEAANGLMKQGMSVSVVHVTNVLMNNQLDPVAANLLQTELEKRGVQFLMEAQTEAILGDEFVTGVRFKDGREVACLLVVMAVGIRPNIDLAKQANLYCERGIVVSDTLQTYDPRIYAVGECAQHRGQAYGLVAPLFEQAKVCANHLARYGIARYEGSVTSTKLKVTGIDLFSAGDFIGNENSEEIVFKDAQRNIYKKLVIEDNRIKGAVMYGDTMDGAWYFQLMRDETDITAFRENILFGKAHVGDAGHGAINQVAALADDAEICGCNGVCKKTIVSAITNNGLFTLDDVRKHTKASASCGSCTGLVEQLLASTVGDYSTAPHKKSLCSCTDLTHDEIRKAVSTQTNQDIPSMMRTLNWKTPDGCHVCRPALNYYLLCAFPASYVDDPQSRFVNERLHANIQKDGTYSVVPRIWGGLTNPQELRAIADVAEKYHVPTVKITGGQRIDLLGVKKEDLPAMWADLNAHGMVSGHAYGKSLRTVKTCVGSEWCRFGTQASMTMGIELEKLTWGSWTPHKFKMAVSGCPRNCAEASIKDFGVVGVDSGWELHIGGNGGIKIRCTDVLCKVKTDAEVIEYCTAFMQLYRQEAHYLERTAPWIERVGLAYVKQKIVEDEAGRKRLAQAFMESQRYAQTDPWADCVAQPMTFKPLPELTAEMA